MVAGPDAGRMIALPSGRHRFGREPTGLVIDDPALEVHHLAIEVGDHVHCVQLSGRIPVRVDGQTLSGFVGVPDGAFVEAGGSLLRLGRRGLREERSSSVSRRWPVTLGIGEIQHEPAAGPNDEACLGSLPFDEQVWVDAGRRRTGVPVMIDLARTPRLGVTGPHRVAVARAIAEVVRERAQAAPAIWWPSVSDTMLGSSHDCRSGVIVVCEAGRYRTAERALTEPSAMIVLAEHVDDLPAECTAQLAVGARWRGTFVADTARGFDDVVALHVAGRSAQRRGPIIAEQISRTGAEFGRRVLGVPQPARRERQAAAPDAGVELIAHSREQLDLLVETWPPRPR